MGFSDQDQQQDQQASDTGHGGQQPPQHARRQAGCDGFLGGDPDHQPLRQRHACRRHQVARAPLGVGAHLHCAGRGVLQPVRAQAGLGLGTCRPARGVGVGQDLPVTLHDQQAPAGARGIDAGRQQGLGGHAHAGRQHAADRAIAGAQRHGVQQLHHSGISALAHHGGDHGPAIGQAAPHHVAHAFVQIGQGLGTAAAQAELQLATRVGQLQGVEQTHGCVSAQHLAHQPARVAALVCNALGQHPQQALLLLQPSGQHARHGIDLVGLPGHGALQRLLAHVVRDPPGTAKARQQHGRSGQRQHRAAHGAPACGRARPRG